MTNNKKISYQQAEALQKANDARRAKARHSETLASEVPEMTDEQKAKWDADRKAALAAYRAKKGAK